MDSNSTRTFTRFIPNRQLSPEVGGKRPADNVRAGRTLSLRVSPSDIGNMGTQRQKHLVLILAREFASSLSTPTLIADARGCLVFYNEAAEAVVGKRFAEAGEMPLDEWLAPFEARTNASTPIPLERRPARVAFDERRASHLRYRVTSADGVEREIEVTAFPLFAHTDEFVGVVVIFWRC